MAIFPLSRRMQSLSIWALYVVGLAPAVWTFYLGATNALGADPVKTFERFLGLWALRFLIVTLAVTPLRDLGGWNWLRYRRALGLLAFYYAAMHFSVYMILDQRLDLGAVIADIVKRPFITVGMICLVLLIPLAATSNNWSIRTMGRNWTRLHRLIYLILAGAAFHYYLSVKVITTEQFVYITLAVLMLAYRLVRPTIMRRKRERASQGRVRTVAAQPPA